MVLKKPLQFFFMRIIISFAALFAYVAQAMDQSIIPKTENIVWKLFFTHNRDVLDYADEHSFAQTSRDNGALLYKIQDYRKNDVYNCILKNNIVLTPHAQYVWHRSWRIFGVVDIVSKKEDETLSSAGALRMFSCELNGNQLPKHKTAIWDNFNAELPHKPLPFFNKNKELCFHGFQKNVYVDHGLTHHAMIFQGVMEYTTNDQFVCELLVPGSQLEPLHIQLVEFLKFPVLLKNILASDKAGVGLFANEPFPQYKSYYIDNVLLSDDYKEFHEFSYASVCVTSFNDLAQSIRNVLTQRYKAQPCKSNK